ncbi:MAG TPA: hypothetical protein VNO26_09655, partial [Candidatus Limnocylindria bacterium]|nr:hypothetical protein [Candidatus Limnocylindria bacterium]
YEDRAAGGFFMTSDDHETLLVREKPGSDGAEPSGNSVAALNLLRLHVPTPTYSPDRSPGGAQHPERIRGAGADRQ